MSVAADVIAAIATPAGRGGVGIVRVSGPSLGVMAATLLGRMPAPRVANFTTFLAEDGTPLDQGFLLFFRGPASFTGEDVIELQGHGGPVVMRQLLGRCVELGARPAAPGEFAKRAFLNGKIDLAEAEAVADLIDAASSEAARAAVRSLQGEFSARIHEVDNRVLALRALTEATLDFPDDGGVEFLPPALASATVAEIGERIARLLGSARQGRLLRDGVTVVLVGQPNVGKSSLLNCLAGEEIAIVTEIPGTTRDSIREVVDVAGVPIHIVDTAGLRATDDPVEKIGIDRTWRAAEVADIAVVIVDARVGAGAAEDEILARLPARIPRVRVVNKIDLIGAAPGVTDEMGQTEVRLSARSGAGMEEFREVLLRLAGWQSTGEGVFLARERHLAALHEAQNYLSKARACSDSPELFAEELRLAHTALGRITGESLADDVLGEIFSRFCIGK